MILNNVKDIKCRCCIDVDKVYVDKVYVGINIVWERYKGLPQEYQQVEYLKSTVCSFL